MPEGIDFVVTFDRANINPAQVAAYVRSPDGEVYRRMFQIGDEFKALAQRLAPVSKPDPIPRRRPITPGRLRDSIVKRMGTDGRGLYVRVGSVGVPYAMYVHEGTVPHGIDPVKAKYLVFQGSSGVVFARHVNHPGNKPNRFFVKAAIEMFGGGNVRGNAT